jgi:hypothetical protein
MGEFNWTTMNPIVIKGTCILALPGDDLTLAVAIKI